MNKLKGALSFALMLICSISVVLGQNSLSGRILDQNRSPLPGATILIKGQTSGWISEENGEFTLTDLRDSTFILQVRYLGFDTKEVAVHLSQESRSIQIQLSESKDMLNDVIVSQSKAELSQQSPIKTEVINAKEFQDQSATLNELINRTPGVRIRQSGGMGSNVQINLNGFQGNSVRVFKNGIPIDYLGAGYSIGLVPTNSLDRVDMYKGVVPVSLGADALGGAINLVSKDVKSSSISASYEFASFNTHRATLNTALVSKNNKFFGGFEAFYNYSDNNYKANVNYVDEVTRNEVPIETELFHNSFRQHYIEAFVGFQNVVWADQFKISAVNFKLHRQNQFGPLMQYPMGAAYNTETGDFIPSLRWEKKFIDNKLKLDQFLVYSKITRMAVDTLNGRYDWRGKFIPNENGQEPGELGSANLTTMNRYNTISQTTAVYSLMPNHTLTLNAVYTKYSQEGDDPYGEMSEGDDPVRLISLPADYNKLVVGLSLDSDLFGDKIQNSLQGKYYNSQSSGLSYDVASGLVSDEEQSASNSTFGVGNSIRYAYKQGSYVLLSGEQATRLPTQREIFGDGDVLLANFGLKPERSTNINLNVHHASNEQLTMEFNLFYRYTKDMISTRLSEEGLFSVNENLDKVKGYGLEMGFHYSFFTHYKLRGNMTYQSFRQVGHQPSETALYDDARVSNMPYFFGNLGLEARLQSIITKKDAIRAYWNYSYVHSYFLKRIPKNLEPDGFLQLWGDPGLETELYINPQHLHSAGLVWKPNKDKALSAGFEVKNIFDKPIYDNFKIQNASRSFHVKLIYSIKL